jgi:hypothetical protein
MVAESQDGFEVGKAPPSVAADKAPEAVADTRVEAFESVIAARREGQAIALEGDFERGLVRRHRREGAAVSVMGADEMEDQIPVV